MPFSSFSNVGKELDQAPLNLFTVSWILHSKDSALQIKIMEKLVKRWKPTLSAEYAYPALSSITLNHLRKPFSSARCQPCLLTCLLWLSMTDCCLPDLRICLSRPAFHVFTAGLFFINFTLTNFLPLLVICPACFFHICLSSLYYILPVLSSVLSFYPVRLCLPVFLIWFRSQVLTKTQDGTVVRFEP